VAPWSSASPGGTAERFVENHLRRSAGMFVVKQRVGRADEVIE